MRKALSVLLSIALLFSLTTVAGAAPLRSLTVTVVDTDGKALEQAAVQLLSPGAERFQIAQTNARGEAFIVLPEGFSFWIRAWSDGHTLVERPYVPSTDGPVVTLTAAPYKAELSGFVTDEKGRPVKDAHVSVWVTNLGLQAAATTAADGRYQFDGLQARDGYQLQVEALGFEPFAQADVSLTAGARNQVDMELVPSTSPITGEVVDSRTNQPVKNVKVELILNGWGVIDQTRTDAYGYFHFAAPPWNDSAYQVRLWGDGYELFTSGAFAVNPGAWVNYTGANRISLNPLYAELSGSVLDQRGEPLANTRVELQRTGLGTIETAQTDNSGFFLFSKLPAGTYRARAVPGGNQEHAASDWVTLEGGDRAAADVAANDPDTESFGSTAIVGTVRDHLGNTVAGAKVTAARGTAQVTATTDTQGRYRLPVEANIESNFDEDSEPSSGYHVYVTKEGYIATDLQEIADGTPPPALVDVRFKATNRANFTLQPATAQVAGRALTDRGLPLAGVTVALVPEGGGAERRVVTDKTGRYVFADLPVAKQARYLPLVTTPDLYFPSSMSPDGTLIAPATLPPGGVLTYSLTVRPTTTVLRGEVKAGTDEPATGATVTVVSPADGKTWTTTVAESGAYTMSVPTVPGRQYLVRASLASTTDGTAAAIVDPGTGYGAVANLTVVPSASVVGRVYTPDGKPAANTEVTLWQEAEKYAVAKVVTDQDGYYRFQDLTPGRRYSVAVWWGVNTWSTLAPGEAIITPLLSPGPGTTTRADLQAPADKSAK
ncbi:MAG TPA: carboxypeptidase-like regulatory domain-containing protein [Symbiobacteriaceae bacterium]|nr:carboxypeptidase-like regulatory domain-containing protein [Symbiobacteriaceae bacterium]